MSDPIASSFEGSLVSSRTNGGHPCNPRETPPFSVSWRNRMLGFRLACGALVMVAACSPQSAPISAPTSPPAAPEPSARAAHGRTIAWGPVLEDPERMASDATTLFWTSEDGQVRAISKQGGPVRIIGSRSDVKRADGIALDAQHVYWTVRSGPGKRSAVLSAPKNGSAPATVVIEGAGISNLAHDGERLFYDTRQGLFSLRAGESPVALAPRDGKDTPWYDIAVDENYVYWSAPSSIQRVPKNGGKVETIAAERASRLVLDKDHVYWFEYGKPWIHRVSKGGGAVEAMVDAESTLRDIAVDDRKLCWGFDDRVRCREQSTGKIHDVDAGWYRPELVALDGERIFYMAASVIRSVPVNETWNVPPPSPRCPRARAPYVPKVPGFSRSASPKAGLHEQTIADSGGSPQEIAVDDAAVYWTDKERGEVVRWDKGSGTSRPLATGQPKPLSLAMDDTHVYWTNDGDGSVMRVLKKGDAPQRLATGQAHPRGLALDETRVYWANHGDFADGSIATVEKSGANMVTMARDIDRPFAVAVDARFVYATMEVYGILLRIPKTGGPAEPLGSSDTAHGMVLDGDDVLWVDGRSGLVRKVAKEGGSAFTLTPTELSTGESATLARHGDDIVFTADDLIESQLLRASNHQGCPVLITDWSPNRLRIVGVATDDVSIYWTEGSTVRQVPWTDVRRP